MCNTKMHHIKKFFCFLVSSFLSFVLWDYFFRFKFLINFVNFQCDHIFLSAFSLSVDYSPAFRGSHGPVKMLLLL